MVMDEKIKELEKEVGYIKERNKRVEADKAWEVSMVRMLSLTVITYIIASLVLYFIGVNNFLLSALVPALGYFLSTQSLPFIKKRWISKFISK
ncbi:MAG: hypothetical protein HQ402_01160 [Parcubacteria group bacterium]|nr:hypothetical protein [Parcubacteria group bacterium]